MKLDFNELTAKLLVGLFIIMLGVEVVAQERESTGLKDFKIVIEKTDSGIKLKSIKGSAWSELSFTIRNDKPQAIDEYGMTELTSASSDKDLKLADFLFTITETEDGIELKSTEGTYWTKLSFSVAQNQRKTIDQYGMCESN